MWSSQRRRVFHVKDEGWVRPSVAVPRPSNRAAVQNAIDRAHAWVMTNDDGRAFYSSGALAPVAWASHDFFDAAAMVGVPARGPGTDWVTPLAGDRMLMKNCSNPALNGIWIIPASGAWTRATDADTSADFFMSLTNVHVLNGFHWAGTRWRVIGGYGPIATLGTTHINWWGVPTTSQAIIVSDGDPIYLDGMLDVKPGVHLALTSPLIGLETAPLIEDLVVFRTDAVAREPLRVLCNYTHGGVRVSHHNPDQRSQFAPIEVKYVGARGTGARDPDAGPGGSTRPLHGFSCYGFPASFSDVYTLGGDLGNRIWGSDMTFKSIYSLAAGDGSWLRIGNSQIGMLNVDSPGNVPLRIDFSAYLHMKAHISTNGPTPTDIVLIGNQLPASWATSRALMLDLIISGAGTNALHIGNVDGPTRINMVQSATVTTAVRVAADVTNRVHIDADLPAADVPHAFDSGVTVGPTVSYRQAGAQKAVKSTGGTHVTVVAA